MLTVLPGLSHLSVERPPRIKSAQGVSCSFSIREMSLLPRDPKGTPSHGQHQWSLSRNLTVILSLLCDGDSRRFGEGSRRDVHRSTQKGRLEDAQVESATDCVEQGVRLEKTQASTRSSDHALEFSGSLKLQETAPQKISLIISCQTLSLWAKLCLLTTHPAWYA